MMMKFGYRYEDAKTIKEMITKTNDLNDPLMFPHLREVIRVYVNHNRGNNSVLWLVVWGIKQLRNQPPEAVGGG